MMGAKGARCSQTAGRRPQAAKPRHIGPLGIWLTIRGGLATCEPPTDNYRKAIGLRG